MAARTHREVRDKACRELRSREWVREEVILRWRGAPGGESSQYGGVMLRLIIIIILCGRLVIILFWGRRWVEKGGFLTDNI